jgi:hypothetical protein
VTSGFDREYCRDLVERSARPAIGARADELVAKAAYVTTYLRGKSPA